MKSPPGAILLAAGGLLAVTLTVAAMGGHARAEDAGRDAAMVVRELRFLDRSDGGIDVVSPDGAAVATIEPGTNGFLRGALRALARERRLNGVGEEPPFQLARTTSGRVVLDDPETGERVDLAAFGPTNAASFAALLTQARR